MPKKVIIKECLKHGKTEYVLEPYRNSYRCRKCRQFHVTKNRKERKLKLVQYFGGKCLVCGYDKCQQALTFHHLNPGEKEFGISANGICRSFERMLEEAKKCVLVCARCHIEIENGITKLELAH